LTVALTICSFEHRKNRAFDWKAGSRIRTDDLLITNQLLYQLSYAGKNAAHTSARCRRKQVVDLTGASAM
jgi:hypothetical protein